MPIIGWFGLTGGVASRREAEGWSVAQYTHALGALSLPAGRVIDLWPPPQLAFFGRTQYRTDPAWYRAVASVEEAFLPDGMVEELGKGIQCPVHVAVGNPALGGLVGGEPLEKFRATGLAFTTTHFDGAGHVISFGQPREFINDLKAFLGRLPQ